MQVNSLVLCVKGFPGIIEEGEIYTVTKVLDRGINVEEATPPPPHTSFFKDRFKEIQPPIDVNALIEEISFVEL